jgi:hypothetical protein
MMKPINHHFSGPVSIPDAVDKTSNKWYCTLAYNAGNNHLGIAVVGKKDQFCRKTGARIALGRTINPTMTIGQFCYKVSSDEELKDILKRFRAVTFQTQFLDLLFKYFPSFKTYKDHSMRKSKLKVQVEAVG